MNFIFPAVAESGQGWPLLREGFFSEQLDYIFFIYGLSFLILSAVCFSLPREEKNPISWRWLGSFGLLHGIGEWLDLLALVGGDSSVFQNIRLSIHTLSFLALTEFAIYGVRIHRQRSYHPGFSLLPLMLVSVLSWYEGWSTFPALIRYGVSFPACMVSGWLLLRILPVAGHKEQRWRGVLALGMVGYGLASGLVVPAVGIWPATLLNTKLFFAWTGVPIQLVRGGMALIMTLALWGTLSQHKDAPPLFGQQKRYNIAFFTVFLVMLLGGWTLTDLLGQLYHQDQANELRVDLDAL
ncbi:MAG: hypothetical protein G8345_06070 [Magnetococcales bacterium]|nr:hypothetical protein [Magnetococcales bacterium]